MAPSAAARARPRTGHSRSTAKKPARRSSGRSGGAHKSVAERNAVAIKSSAAARKKAATPDSRSAARPMAAGAAAAVALPLPVRVARAPFTRALRARGGGVLDALLYGRAWIALVGVLLAGIVFFNVDLLKLNREIAATAHKASGVARENSRLRLELAELNSSERIQRAAAARGLLLPAPGDVRYLRANPLVDARRAAKLVEEPAGFMPPPAAASTPPASTAPAAQGPATPGVVAGSQPQPATSQPQTRQWQPPASQPPAQAPAQQPQAQAGTGTTAAPAG